MRQPSQRLTEPLATHLTQIVGDSADAGEEKAESGKVERKQFNHGAHA
jgi:hypothetical protein